MERLTRGMDGGRGVAGWAFLGHYYRLPASQLTQQRIGGCFLGPSKRAAPCNTTNKNTKNIRLSKQGGREVRKRVPPGPAQAVQREASMLVPSCMWVPS